MFTQTYSSNVLPLDLVNVSPGEGFSYLPMPSTEGIHTGGLWLSPCGEYVWKPLDARPYPNSECRVPTLEADCLLHMKGQIGFIDNWEVKESNSRWWVVRPYCKVVGQSFPIEWVTQEVVEQVEGAVRTLNAHHWEAFTADDLSVAIDPHTQLPFLLDLSNAHYKSAQGNWKADDSDTLYRWMKAVGWGRVAELREQGRSLLHSREWLTATRFNERYECNKHVYRIAEPFKEIPTEGVSISYKDQWWWVLPFCLSPELCDRYQAEWAWSPIPYRPQSMWLALDTLLSNVESWYRSESELNTYNPAHQQEDIQLVTQLLRSAMSQIAVETSELNALHAPFVVEHQEHTDSLMWLGEPTGWLVKSRGEAA